MRFFLVLLANNFFFLFLYAGELLIYSLDLNALQKLSLEPVKLLYAFKLQIFIWVAITPFVFSYFYNFKKAKFKWNNYCYYLFNILNIINWTESSKKILFYGGILTIGNFVMSLWMVRNSIRKLF